MELGVCANLDFRYVKIDEVIRTHWPSENTMEIEFLIRWIFHHVGITKKSKFGLSLPYEIFRQELDSFVVPYCSHFWDLMRPHLDLQPQ